MALRPLSAGFPVTTKKPLDLSGKGFAGPMGTQLYKYWTDYRPRKKTYAVSEVRLQGHWQFTTNLKLEDDFPVISSRRFLSQMYDAYGSP